MAKEKSAKPLARSLIAVWLTRPDLDELIDQLSALHGDRADQKARVKAAIREIAEEQRALAIEAGVKVFRLHWPDDPIPEYPDEPANEEDD